MKTYIIRFNHPERGTISAEVVAGTEADAREDFAQRHPHCEIIGSNAKPQRWDAYRVLGD
ncbi:hypothetical protein [Paenibacillus sp.]|uniref:hypothetical protein n=1 Tax=Paenibacillus sp. TaxID=58172 RepID=UPI002D3EEC8B|nr:hypothetical protein [Paenibacillus sp.]HZG83869.1 hypothetical protein [Paenibacillus sp.]